MLRAWGLVLFGAAGAYLFATIIISRPAMWIAQAASAIESPLMRVLIGVVTIDVSKLLGLVPTAWLLGPQLGLRPLTGATGLVALCVAMETAVAWALQQGAWIWSGVAIIVIRTVIAAGLVLVVARVLKRRQRPANA